MSDAAEPHPNQSFLERSGFGDLAHPAVMAFLLLCAATALSIRFVVPSPMWLDEALSVNISSLPLGRIPEALRHDGHPPLYYGILHVWMMAFGHSTTAVRALSGLVSILTLPLAWAAGRRLGTPRTAVTVTLVLALSPFALHFGSEARMYSMVIAEVFALFIVISDGLSTERRAPLVGTGLLTALLLWTHYWSIWLLATVGLVLVARFVRTRARRPLEMIGAMAVGAIAFGPWVPTLLYQAQHTGTPWSKSFRPTTLVYSSFVEFAGGPYSESQLLLLAMTVLLFLGITGKAIDARRIEVDLAARPDAAMPLGLLVGTIVVASVAGAATGMAFAPRYAAVYFPFFVMLVGLGLDRFSRGAPRDVCLVAVGLLSLVGMYVTFTFNRSQSRDVAHHIEATAPAGIVVVCPDQLGPPVRRELEGRGYEVLAYPRLDDARFIDWVDYADRNRRNDPVKVADAVLARAGNRPIFVAYRDDFLTLKGQCGALIGRLASQRNLRQLTTADGELYYEPIDSVVLTSRS